MTVQAVQPVPAGEILLSMFNILSGSGLAIVHFGTANGHRSRQAVLRACAIV